MEEKEFLPKKPFLPNLSMLTAIVCCLLAMSFGFFALSGRQFDHPLVAQIEPTLAPMVYDAALCFCIASIGLLALLFLQKNIITKITAILLLLLAVITFIQHILQVDWHVTQKIVFPFLSMAPKLGGKMLPMTSFCFLLTSLALFYMDHRAGSKRTFIFAHTQGTIILSLGILFLFGYVIHIDRAATHQFAVLTPMTANDSLGFIFLGIAIIFTVVYLSQQQGYDFKKSFPILIAAFLSVVSLLSWRFLITQTQLAQFIASLDWFTTARELLIAALFGAMVYFYQMARSSENYTRRLLAMTRATFEATSDGILVVDNKQKVVDFNQKFLHMWQMNLPKLKEDASKEIFPYLLGQLKNSDEILYKLSELKQHPKKSFKNELYLKDKRIFEAYSHPQHIGNQIIGQVYNFHDITHLKAAKTQLVHQATHDALTGLANRHLLFKHIEEAIRQCKSYRKLFAVFFIDFNRFKLINDSLGHDIGDKLLKAASERFTGRTRAGDTLARLGGDEFIALVLNIDGAKDAIAVAKKYMDIFSHSFYIENHELHVSCSIGISLYPQDGNNPGSLLKNADIAMYHAKKSQKHFEFYTEHMHERVITRLILENELPHAINNNELVLYYQPIIDLNTNKITATEALVRWNHPQHGLLMPDRFISTAEETGAIIDIGKWVMRAACLQNQRWQEQNILIAPISVNVSIRQLQQSDFLQLVNDTLQQTSLPAKYLELEFTEGKLLRNIHEASDLFQQLHNTGITVTIDDFGSGYTGLGYFKYLPLSNLKIDSSFIKDLPENLQDSAIVCAILNMCKKLNIKTIAEGVESKEQCQFLHDNGCDEVQGYFFSRPLPAGEYEQFVKNFQSNP